MDLCDQLGVSLNVAKHQRCAQTVDYSGFLYDTFRSLMLVTEPKQESLLANTAELRDPESVWTISRLDSIKGRLLHYSAAIVHLRIYVTELARLMGPVEEASYDQTRPAPPGIPELAEECADIIRRFFPFGGALGFQAAIQRADLHGRVCILLNDASAAIAGFHKGSSQSPAIQRCALLLSRCPAAANVDLLPWHVPGLQLVAEGVYGASRAGDDFGPGCNVESSLGPAVSVVLWSSVLRDSAAAGWHITVDAFATESNACAPRF
jgi:hypothetical protein